MIKTQVTLYALVAACAANLSVARPTESTMRLDIEAKPLDQAIRAWAAQTGYQVLIAQQRADGYMTADIKGTYTPEAALHTLLGGTNFRYQFVNDNTVAIHMADASETSPT